jgi:hypothetical protein
MRQRDGLFRGNELQLLMVRSEALLLEWCTEIFSLHSCLELMKHLRGRGFDGAKFLAQLAKLRLLISHSMNAWVQTDSCKGIPLERYFLRIFEDGNQHSRGMARRKYARKWLFLQNTTPFSPSTVYNYVLIRKSGSRKTSTHSVKSRTYFEIIRISCKDG